MSVNEAMLIQRQRQKLDKLKTELRHLRQRCGLRAADAQRMLDEATDEAAYWDVADYLIRALADMAGQTDSAKGEE